VSADVYARYRDDPAAFFAEVLGFNAWSAQLEIAEAVRDHDRVAVKACNASGKTACASAIVPWWLAGGPGSIAITTAPTERQVKKLLWREIRSRMKHAGEFFHGAVLTDTEILLGADWFATGLSTDETESFQGWHGSRVLVIVDEASGVDERIFEAIEGVLAGGEAKLLLISNPLRTSGAFFDAFARDRDLWKLFTISAHDTPNLSGEEVPREVRKRLVSRRWVERNAKRGVDSNEYRVRVLGEFPTESDDGVVALGDLEQAHAQTFEPGLPLVVGVDVARFGSDKTVIAVRRGNVIRVARSFGGRDLMQTTGAVTEVARGLREEAGRRPVIVVDDVGLGGGVTDRLRELAEFRIVDHNGGRKASTRDYPNKRSQSWFEFAELLPVLDLDPADEELASDLLAPTYSLASDAKRVVEAKANTKKRLRRSPDRADAVILCCAVEPPRAPGQPRRARTRSSVPRGRIDGGRSDRYSPAGRVARRQQLRAKQRAENERVAERLGLTAYDSRTASLPHPAVPPEPVSPLETAGYFWRGGDR
jgi:phage terminase large subunit